MSDNNQINKMRELVAAKKQKNKAQSGGLQRPEKEIAQTKYAGKQHKKGGGLFDGK